MAIHNSKALITLTTINTANISACVKCKQVIVVKKTTATLVQHI